MAVTLAEALVDDRVAFDELHRRYRPVLGMVKVLIGVVPNCDPYLEIWPPGFRTYNLVVPSFLNLPASLLNRAAPKDIVGLSMYASSRAAACAYCSAHTCSFALRRGSSPEAVTGQARTPAEAAAADVAETLSAMPHRFTAAHRAELHRHFSPGDAEWVAMAIALMGFLNKFMDGLGVELEPESVHDVAALIEPTGWSIGQHGWAGTIDERPGGAAAGGPPVDSLGTLARVLRNAPGAVRLDRAWTAGIPADGPAARRHVADRYGWDEPALAVMSHQRPRRALAAVLRHNLDASQSVLGIGPKALAGLAFAIHAANDALTDRSRKLAAHAGMDESTVEAVTDWSGRGEAVLPDDARLQATLTVARAIAPSPAEVDPESIRSARDHLSAAEVVELVVWVSVCQLLHRLGLWHDLAG